jgi:hypothetical protein
MAPHAGGARAVLRRERRPAGHLPRRALDRLPVQPRRQQPHLGRAAAGRHQQPPGVPAGGGAGVPGVDRRQPRPAHPCRRRGVPLPARRWPAAASAHPRRHRGPLWRPAGGQCRPA